MGDLENTIGFSHMDYFLGERAKESERDPPRVTREALLYQQLAASELENSNVPQAQTLLPRKKRMDSFFC